MSQADLKLGVSGCSSERNDVAYIGHARHKHQHTFESHSEAAMRDGAKSSQVKIPSVIFLAQFMVLQMFLKNLKPFFPLAAPDDLPNSRDQYIHGCDCFTIVVGSHVKWFDGFWIIVNRYRTLEVFFCQIAFVF